MNPRTFEDKVLLITGADGEIGTALIQEMLNRKARKIYATGIVLERLHQLASTCPSKIALILLDVTQKDSIQKAVEQSILLWSLWIMRYGLSVAVVVMGCVQDLVLFDSLLIKQIIELLGKLLFATTRFYISSPSSP